MPPRPRRRPHIPPTDYVPPQPGKPWEAPPKPEAYAGPRPPASDYTSPAAPGKFKEKLVQTFERRWPGKRLVVNSKRVNMTNTAAAVADLDRVMEKYPVGAEHLKSIHIDSQGDLRRGSRARGTQAYWHPSLREIHIGDSVVNDGDDSFDKRFQVSQGWHPEGCVTVRSTVNHEFGHAIDYAIRRGRHHTDPLRVKWENFHRDHMDDLRVASGYATDAFRKRGNNDEGVAESFSQLEEHESGRWGGKLHRGPQALKDFFSDMKNREAGGVKEYRPTY